MEDNQNKRREKVIQAVKDKKIVDDTSFSVFQMTEDLKEYVDDKIGKLEKDESPDEKAEKLASKLAAKFLSLEKGDKGDMPSEDDLRSIIAPLIPEPVKGEKGDSYVLSDKDRKEIARSIEVPVVSKETVVEKTEVVKEVVTPLLEKRIASVEETIKKLPEQKETDLRPIQNTLQQLQKDISDTRQMAASNAMPVTTSFFNGLRAKNLNIVGGTATQSGDTVNVTVSGGGSGSVTSVASADGSVTVTNPTSTVDLAVVKAPKLTTARTIGGTSFDGTANIKIGALNSTNINATTSAELAGVISDETGSGNLVFSTLPTLTTPIVNNIYFTPSGTAAEQFYFYGKGGAGIPVPFFYPNTANTALAFDISPNGTPGNTYGIGPTWIDLLSTDVNNANYEVLRLSKRDAGNVYLTSAQGGTGSYRDMSLQYDFSTSTIAGKVGIGLPTPTANLDVTASTTGAAALRLRSGSTPTSPNTGDLWFDGTHLQFRNGATTNQLDQQSGSGTVTSVATDATLTGGPITTTGTLGINLANSNTWTGAQTISTVPFTISGNQTTAAWTTNGTQLAVAAATLSDNSSTGTVTTNAASAFGIPTFTTPTNAVTYTNGATLYIAGAPVNGTNVTISNKYSLFVAGGTSQFNGTVLGNGLFQSTTGSFTTIQTNGTMANSNFVTTGGTSATTQSAAQYQFAGSSTNFLRSVFYGSTNTALSTGANYSGVLFASAPINTASSGTNAWLANLVVNPIGTIGGSTTATNSASLYIGGAGSGATNNYALYSASGLNFFGGHMNVEGVTTTGATGTGKLVFDTSPTLVTPALGAATGSSLVVTYNNTNQATPAITINSSDATTAAQAVLALKTNNVLRGDFRADGNGNVGFDSSGTGGIDFNYNTGTGAVNFWGGTTVSKFGVSNAGAITQAGKTTNYNSINTTGWGVPAIYGTGRATGQTAANASVATYTVGAADGSFYVSANVLVTTSSAESFTVTVSYTDEGNTARTLTFNFQTIGGTIGTTVAFANGAVPYEGVPVHLRCKASTAITIKTAAGGTYTGCTYNVEGSITQIA